MHLVDALGQNKELEPIPCHHEQAAGIAAEAYSRVTENIGVALVTTGPGATNVITPVAGAWIESVPLLIISGQVKRADRIGESDVRQMGVQEVDIVPMVESITKYAVTVDDPKQIRYHLEKALHLARSGRQGPVWIDVPLDVQAAPIKVEALAGFTAAQDGAEVDATHAWVAKTLALLEQAQRPLILAGHGIRLAGAASDFSRLLERLQIPVVTTWNAADLIPYDHPQCVGRPGSVALRGPNFAVQNCDLLISIGARLDNVVTAYNTPGFARGAKKIVLDVDRMELDKLNMEIALKIECDAHRFIKAMLDSAPNPCERPEWLNRCRDWKKRYPVCDGQAFPSHGEISHYHFMTALAEAIAMDELIVTGSSGLGVEVFYTVFANKPGQRIFLTSGLGAMGYGLPAVIGGCLAHGRRPTIGVESDGSLMLNLQELYTLKQLNLPVRLFIINNRGYASIRNTQRNYFAGRFVASGPESGLGMADFAALGEAVGLPTRRITDITELNQGLEQALAQPGPLLIDVRVTPDETLWPKVAALPQPDGSMLSMPLEDMSPLLPLTQLQDEMIIPLHPASQSARDFD
jgi:acetolactate synthase-1/2/3 large subunit